MELCGNIRVHVRVRPILDTDRAHNDSVEVLKCLNAYEVEAPSITQQGVAMRFEFDHVYAPNAMAYDITNETAPLMTSLLDGFVVAMITVVLKVLFAI